MKLSRAAIGLATVGGLAAVGAGMVVMRLLARGRAGAPEGAPEPPSPEQLIGIPQSHLSAAEAATTFETKPSTQH